MTVAELTRQIGRFENEDFEQDIWSHTGQWPAVEYNESAAVPDGVATHWLSLAHSPDAVVRVEKPRSWWQANYTVCLQEAMNALESPDRLDLEYILHILPVLAAASHSPELDELAAKLRASADDQLSEAEQRDAQRAVTWVGATPSTYIGEPR